jgi:hypothetical protein
MLKRTATLALALLTIVTVLPACSEASILKWSKETSTQASEALASVPAAVDALVARGRLTAEDGEARKASFKRVSESYAPLDDKLQSLNRLDATAALEVLPLAESFVKTLDAEKLIKLPDNPEAAKWYADVCALLDLFGSRLVARLRSKASGARQSFFEVRQEKTDTEGDLKRLRTLLAA